MIDAVTITVLALPLWIGTAPPSDLTGAEAGPSSQQEIIDRWQLRQSRLDRFEFRLERSTNGDMDRFACDESNWLPTSGEAFGSRPALLRVDKDILLFDAWRTADGPHGYVPADVGSVTATVGRSYPERMATPFIQALLGRFADPDAERRPAQRFHRSFDGQVLHDLWESAPGAYPRSTVFKSPDYGSAAWSLFRYEEDPTEQLQTLEMMGLLASLSPLHPLLGVRPESLVSSGVKAIVNGAECVLLQENGDGDANSFRSLMVDPQAEYVIRRWIGRAGDNGIQIDIDYMSHPEWGWLPESWTVMRFHSADRPVQQFSRGMMVNVGPTSPIPNEQVDFAYPPGTWVVDQRLASSYLVLENGESRVVRGDELRWLPTYPELLQTESGQVGELIEARIRRQRYWNLAKWPLGFSVAVFFAAVVFRWRLGRRADAKETAPVGASMIGRNRTIAESSVCHSSPSPGAGD